MVPPQQYRVRVTLHAVDATERHGFVQLPKGATVMATGSADASHLVAVSWQGRELIVFEEDLMNAADPIPPLRG